MLGLVAADAATGETRWTYRFDEDPARGVVRQNNRGLGYWTDGREERLIVITPGYQLIAVDAKTGRGIPGFGTKGAVDLFVGLDREKVEPGTIGATSPVMIVKDTAVVGAALLLGTRPKSKTNVPGFVRGYDVRTGKLKWTFRTIPRPGEFGNETWENGSWKDNGNAGVWTQQAYLKASQVTAGDGFRPELLMVSAGFDAHRDDPLAAMRLTASSYGAITSLLTEAAANYCQGRLVSVLEGGYHLEGLAESVETHLLGLLEASS